MTRTKRSTLTFRRAFTLEGVDPSFPSGTYELVTDEELTEDFRFLRHRHMCIPRSLVRFGRD